MEQFNNQDWEDFSKNKLSYECVRCGAINSSEDIALRAEMKCINCGYHVLKKVKPPVVKRLKAE